MAVLHKIKTERNGELVEVMLTPMKAIRKNCLECSNFSQHEVRHCPITTCPLYPYRIGKKPTDEVEVENDE